MDSFSLALLVGYKINKYTFLYSLLIGLFHFFMPIIGFTLGSLISNLSFNRSLLSFLIFTIIWVEMLKDLLSGEDNFFSFKLISILLIALGVSLDSFGVGLTILSDILLASTIFSLVAFTNTFIGLTLSKYLKTKLGNKSLILGITILFLLSLIHLKDFILSI